MKTHKISEKSTRSHANESVKVRSTNGDVEPTTLFNTITVEQVLVLVDHVVVDCEIYFWGT